MIFYKVMNKIFIKLLSVCFVCMICFTSCDKYPIDALLGLKDPVGTWPNPWYLYDDQWNTKGSQDPFLFDHYESGEINPYCDTWDNVKLDFNCTDSSQSGTKCIKFSWIGNSNGSGKTFFTFGMLSRVKKGNRIESIDLSESGYTKLKFCIRGTLYKDCCFEIGIPGVDEATKEYSAQEISPVWQEKEIDINLNGATKIMYDLSLGLKVSIGAGIGGTTNGGSVYLDNIRFTKD